MDDRIFFAFALIFALAVVLTIHFLPSKPINDAASVERWRHSLSGPALLDMP